MNFIALRQMPRSELPLRYFPHHKKKNAADLGPRRSWDRSPLNNSACILLAKTHLIKQQLNKFAPYARRRLTNASGRTPSNIMASIGGSGISRIVTVPNPKGPCSLFNCCGTPEKKSSAQVPAG